VQCVPAFQTLLLLLLLLLLLVVGTTTAAPLLSTDYSDKRSNLNYGSFAAHTVLLLQSFSTLLLQSATSSTTSTTAR
jgi:hypothetical protein